MTFDRARIKEYAKAILKRSHWTVVLAVLIVSLLGGTIAGGISTTINLNTNVSLSDLDNSETNADGWWYDEGDGVYDNPWEDAPQDGYPQTEDPWVESDAEMDSLFYVMFGVFAVVMVIVIVLAIGWSIFMGNVMTVGGHGWLLRYWRGETPSVGAVFDAFRIYGKAVGTMFIKELYTFLWSLLFIIPGIVKSYAYSMVPYIIYENPNLTANQAIKMSEKMTDGYKVDLFVFYLSYFGWHLLSSITVGIVGVLYVNPYMGVAHAGVYEDLKWKAIQSGRLTWEDFGQTPPPPAPPYGYDPRTGYPVQPNGYAPYPQSGYPAQPNGYAPYPQGGYPAQPNGYAPYPQGGYPAQPNGYAPYTPPAPPYTPPAPPTPPVPPVAPPTPAEDTPTREP